MTSVSSNPIQASGARSSLASGRSASTGFREDARVIAFMALGLLFSFAYVYSGAFSLFSRAQLPRPLFTSLAVILSVLLLTPPRRWWLYLTVYYVLQVGLAAWFTTISLPLLAISNIANVFEPLIDAALFRRFVPHDRTFGQLREVSIYVLCVTVGALLSAVWGATSRLFLGSAFWPSFQGWFQSDVLASLVLVPTIVVWANTDLRALLSAPRLRLLEAGLLGAALVVSAGLIFGAETNGSEVAPALLYVPIPLLIWAAVRFGTPGLAHVAHACDRHGDRRRGKRPGAI